VSQIAVVAKQHRVSEQAIYKWRKRFGMFQADDGCRLKQLEAENAPLGSAIINNSERLARAKTWRYTYGQRRKPGSLGSARPNLQGVGCQAAH
jgi:hypothetical protein